MSVLPKVDEEAAEFPMGTLSWPSCLHSVGIARGIESCVWGLRALANSAEYQLDSETPSYVRCRAETAARTSYSLVPGRYTSAVHFHNVHTSM